MAALTGVDETRRAWLRLLVDHIEDGIIFTTYDPELSAAIDALREKLEAEI